MPALLTNTSRGPPSASTRSTSPSTVSGSERSAGWAVPPSRDANSFSGPSLRATNATREPAPAKAMASASPMPREAPVMRTRLPWSSMLRLDHPEGHAAPGQDDDGSHNHQPPSSDGPFDVVGGLDEC